MQGGRGASGRAPPHSKTRRLPWAFCGAKRLGVRLPSAALVLRCRPRSDIRRFPTLASLPLLRHTLCMPTRRSFLKTAAATGTAIGLGDLSFLGSLPRVSAAETKLPGGLVPLESDIEPLVRLLEQTPRDKLLEEIASRIHRGLTYREVLAALMLAGVRNIQPRPVGFKFHAVLVVNSAHLASQSSPDSDRWLPIFWALDYFKSAQAQNVREGDWHMRQVNESQVPASHKAKAAFVEAMDNWDEAAADTAVTGLARTTGALEAFEIVCRYGARDFREIGHKAIYVANSWRTLQAIGWRYAEPVLRSLAYGLLDHDGGNPAKGDAEADRPFRKNQELVTKIRADWQDGKPDGAATLDVLQTLRTASHEEASAKVVALLNHSAAAKSVWDGIFASAAELLARRPGLVSLHALTSTNALHFAYQTSGNDETRRLLLLQNAAFLTLFRGDPKAIKELDLDKLESDGEKESAPSLDDIFATLSRDRLGAARKVLAWSKKQADPNDFINAARRLVFLKGSNSHDYKFSSAVLEDCRNLSPAWRARFLAASVFNLKGSGDKDNDLVKRTRAALA